MVNDLPGKSYMVFHGDYDFPYSTMVTILWKIIKIMIFHMRM